MVDIPDTKGFAVKTSAERFKQCPLPYNYRRHNREGSRGIGRHRINPATGPVRHNEGGE
jgi:hypothetical protein